MSDSPTHAVIQAQLNTDGDSDETIIRTPDADEVNFNSIQEERLFNFLQEYHRGAANAITAAEIAEELHIQDGEGSPKTRTMLRNIHSEGVPLVAQTNGNPGFYIPITPEEGYKYVKNLDSRIEGTKERREQAIRNIMLNMVPESEVEEDEAEE